eukprot:scpid51124/ scgid32469/ 
MKSSHAHCRLRSSSAILSAASFSLVFLVVVMSGINQNFHLRTASVSRADGEGLSGHSTMQRQQQFQQAAYTSSHAENSVDAWLCTWYDCRPAAFSMTFDDGRWSAIELGARIMTSYGVFGTFYIVTERLKNRGESYRKTLGALLDLGHELGGHTVSHVHLLNQTFPVVLHPDYEHEIGQSAADLRSAFVRLSGEVSMSFAYPYGSGCHNQKIKRVVDQTYLAARGLDTDINWSQVAHANQMLYLRTMTWASQTTANDMRRWLKTIVHAGQVTARHGIAQSRTWLVIVGHGVKKAEQKQQRNNKLFRQYTSAALPSDHVENGYEPAAEAEFSKAMLLAGSLQRKRQLWAAPLVNVSRFIRTRDSVLAVERRIAWQGSRADLVANAKRLGKLLGLHYDFVQDLALNQCFGAGANVEHTSVKDDSSLAPCSNKTMNETCYILDARLRFNREISLPADPHPLSISLNFPMLNTSRCTERIRTKLASFPGTSTGSLGTLMLESKMCACHVLPMQGAGYCRGGAIPTCKCTLVREPGRRVSVRCVVNKVNAVPTTCEYSPRSAGESSVRVAVCYSHDCVVSVQSDGF